MQHPRGAAGHPDCFPQKRHLSGIALHKAYLKVGATNGERKAGEACAAADIEDAAWAGRQQWQELETVGNMAVSDVAASRRSNEILGCLPRFEKADVAIKPRE
jgi:hypothetical protein